MSSTIRSQPAAAAASTPGLYARHSSDGNNNGRSSSSSMCSTLWVERFIDRNEKGERKKNGKKFHSTKTTRRLYCVIILDVFFSLRRLLKTRPSWRRIKSGPSFSVQVVGQHLMNFLLDIAIDGIQFEIMTRTHTRISLNILWIFNSV